MNKFWEFNIQHGVYNYQYYIVYMNVAKRVDHTSEYFLTLYS